MVCRFVTQKYQNGQISGVICDKAILLSMTESDLRISQRDSQYREGKVRSNARAECQGRLSGSIVRVGR